MSIRVLSAGLLTSIQDQGRFGRAAIGVGAAGAMDPIALRLANALAGNDEGAAALEITLRGPRLRFAAACTIALTGADVDARCAGAKVPMWRPVLLPAGAELDIGGARRGVRAYLALEGGVDVAPLLGSRSTDVNAALGPFGGRALAQGDVLAVGRATARHPVAFPARAGDAGEQHSSMRAASWSLDPAPWFETREQPFALIRGAHFDRLDAASQAALFTQAFRIDDRSNRVGCRLAGQPLRLREPLELISEGVVAGTVQLPPGGEPIILTAEAPTTGGYPRIGHVAAFDRARLAQRRPGETVRFVEVALAEAQTRYLEQERALRALLRTIRERVNFGL